MKLIRFFLTEKKEPNMTGLARLLKEEEIIIGLGAAECLVWILT